MPIKRSDPILLRLHPSEEQRNILQHWWEFSIEGVAKYSSGEIRQSVYASKVYWKYQDHYYTNWEPERTEYILACEPAELKITQYFGRDPSANESERVHVTFWVTPNSLLSHVRTIDGSEGGGFSVETVHLQTFHLDGGPQLTHKMLFRHYRNDVDERVYFEEPILGYHVTDADRSITERDEFIRQVEDFLLLLSFAARHRTVWLGWEAADSQALTTFFRKNVSVPSAKPRSFDDELIHLQQVEEFIRISYRNYVASESYEGLRRALNYIIPREGEYLDSSFILLYAALETLVLDFRRKKQLEFIFPAEEERAAFQKQLRKWVKDQSPIRNDEKKRKLVYDKLTELNRISFGAALNEFCNEYNLKLDDLWPVLGKTQDMPLSQIRNKIVHGDSFVERGGGLHSARENLRWCVERMVLAVLGWPVEDSRAGVQYLANARLTMYDWKAHRQVMLKQA